MGSGRPAGTTTGSSRLVLMGGPKGVHARDVAVRWRSSLLPYPCRSRPARPRCREGGGCTSGVRARPFDSTPSPVSCCILIAIAGWVRKGGHGLSCGAGIEPPRDRRPGAAEETCMDKNKKIIGAARETLAAHLKTDYENGASIRTLANNTGRSYGFVHRVLTETGITLRERGGPNNSKTDAPSPTSSQPPASRRRCCAC